jgi:malonyl-CoA O-methyltransferase
MTSATLPPREAYRLWAPRYAAETVVSRLEETLVAALAVPTAGRALLDVGCGTARRLAAAGARLGVGVDLTPEMLPLAGADAACVVGAADVRALPFAAGAFDVVWCRLVVGHVRELDDAYAELARVCRPGGAVVVTDFHPAAVAAGHARSFRDPRSGAERTIEHHVHQPEAQAAAAARAGLAGAAQREGAVGPAVRDFYAAAGRLAAYEAQRGLPVVVALAFRKEGAR